MVKKIILPIIPRTGTVSQQPTTTSQQSYSTEAIEETSNDSGSYYRDLAASYGLTTHAQDCREREFLSSISAEVHNQRFDNANDLIQQGIDIGLLNKRNKLNPTERGNAREKIIITIEHYLNNEQFEKAVKLAHKCLSNTESVETRKQITNTLKKRVNKLGAERSHEKSATLAIECLNTLSRDLIHGENLEAVNKAILYFEENKQTDKSIKIIHKILNGSKCKQLVGRTIASTKKILDKLSTNPASALSFMNNLFIRGYFEESRSLNESIDSTVRLGWAHCQVKTAETLITGVENGFHFLANIISRTARKALEDTNEPEAKRIKVYGELMLLAFQKNLIDSPNFARQAIELLRDKSRFSTGASIRDFDKREELAIEFEKIVAKSASNQPLEYPL